MNKGHDFGADCWSLGVLIFELLTGKSVRTDKLKNIYQWLGLCDLCAHFLNNKSIKLYYNAIFIVAIYSSIHPFSTAYQMVRSWGNSPGAGGSGAFPGQPRDIVSPACPGSSLGLPIRGTCSEHLTREASRRHSKWVTEQPHLASLTAEKQRLYFKLLHDGWAPHPISKEEPSHSSEKTHFSRFFSGSYFWSLPKPNDRRWR